MFCLPYLLFLLFTFSLQWGKPMSRILNLDWLVIKISGNVFHVLNMTTRKHVNSVCQHYFITLWLLHLVLKTFWDCFFSESHVSFCMLRLMWEICLVWKLNSCDLPYNSRLWELKYLTFCMGILYWSIGERMCGLFS